MSGSTIAQTRVAVGCEHQVFTWDTVMGGIAGPFTCHQAWVRALVFFVDGKYITSAADDYTVRVWDSMTGDIVRSQGCSEGGAWLARRTIESAYCFAMWR